MLTQRTGSQGCSLISVRFTKILKLITIVQAFLDWCMKYYNPLPCADTKTWMKFRIELGLVSKSEYDCDTRLLGGRISPLYQKRLFQTKAVNICNKHSQFSNYMLQFIVFYRFFKLVYQLSLLAVRSTITAENRFTMDDVMQVT